MRLPAFAAVLLLTGVCVAAENGPAAVAQQQGQFVSLFDGKSFDGWKIIHCDAEIKDGCIFLKGGNGVVRTDKAYKDFVLEVEWKALKADKWDSGIFFRCIDPVGSYPWPRTYQANLRQGQEGDVQELKTARSKGLARDHEWNQFKLTVVGATAELEINGKPAWKATGVKDPSGFIALQAEIPGGGQFLFRNIRVMELQSK